MRGYVAAVWRCRHFWLSLVGMDLRTRYRRSVLGVGWSLLQPICMSVIFCVVFQQFFGVDPAEYGAFVLAGLAFWNYVLAVSLHSCLCFFYGEAYIRQSPMPLAIYPLRSALGGAFHFLLALIVVVAASWLFHGFDNLATLPALIPAILLLLVFGWSLALLMGFATVYFQDTQHVTEVAAQVLFYATPIIYTPEALGDRFGWILRLNPLASFLALIRDPILKCRIPDAGSYGIAGLTTLALFSFACVTLFRLQHRLIFRM
jgi:ABC-type polysaccharide/polyol phosphate export permease